MSVGDPPPCPQCGRYHHVGMCPVSVSYAQMPLAAEPFQTFMSKREADTQAAIADLLPENGCIGVPCRQAVRECDAVAGEHCIASDLGETLPHAVREDDADTVREWLKRQGWDA